MRNVEDIIKNVDVLELLGEKKELEGKICFDSRNVSHGDMFVAVPGTRVDGHDYIPVAITSGASFIVCERFPAERYSDICYILVRDAHESLGLIASAYYDHPSTLLKIVGVTGTNGKTTIASLLYRMCTSMGYSCGLISTINVMFNDVSRNASHTTPDPVQIQSTLSDMVMGGCEYVFMEVSSHAVDQKRIAGIQFVGGIFTNLTHDHLDYHKDFSSYRDAKKKYFDSLGPEAFALVNKDDRNGMIMLQNTRAKKATYSLKSASEFKARLMELHLEGNLLDIEGEKIWIRLPGRFNAYNVLAVYAAAILLGLKKEEVLTSLSNMVSVEGRFEIIRAADGPTAIVDYAHTPDALENVLKTIREIRQGDRIICVVGAGGNRDRSKRPEMARIAAGLSDRVILTSDNPRDEDADKIIADMKEGLDIILSAKVMAITNREEAIRTACAFAEKEDVILVAGKGHETYQEIRGTRHHFDDREILRKFLNI